MFSEHPVAHLFVKTLFPVTSIIVVIIYFVPMVFDGHMTTTVHMVAPRVVQGRAFPCGHDVDLYLEDFPL